MGADLGFCPRCGAMRPDAFRYCRKCGLDFDSALARVVASQQAASTRQLPSPGRLDVRPVMDRATMAQLTKDSFTIRCAGTAGGMIGGFLGFLVFGGLGASMLGPGGALLALIGAPVGFFIGVRAALGFAGR